MRKRPSRAGTRQQLDFAGDYRVLTATAAMTGQVDLAKTGLQELRCVQPNISPARMVSHMFSKEKADREPSAARAWISCARDAVVAVCASAWAVSRLTPVERAACGVT